MRGRPPLAVALPANKVVLPPLLGPSPDLAVTFSCIAATPAAFFSRASRRACVPQVASPAASLVVDQTGAPLAAVGKLEKARHRLFAYTLRRRQRTGQRFCYTLRRLTFASPLVLLAVRLRQTQKGLS